MTIQSISFKTPSHTSINGPLPDGSDIPIMKGKKNITDKELIKLLDDALESLSRSDCSYAFCDGATRPKDMVTCSKCYAMRSVAKAKAGLERRINGK
jgi:hypothetical protein